MISATKRSVRRRTPSAVPESLAEDIHPVLAQVYADRGIHTPTEIDYALAHLESFAAMKGISEAAALLEQALREQWSILVVGDYDVDGATSTTVALRALRMMGARQVDFLVPRRFEYGYGLTPEIVAVAQERRPDLLVTVDNGISSLRGVAAAHEAGMRVLITDHHLPGDVLPEADVIVNPNQQGDRFPGKALAGVGVIFYVMLALRAHLRESGWFDAQQITPPNLAQLLDLVALGTVADVVPLDRINRTLVAQGMARIRAGQGCIGIQALIDIAARQHDKMVAVHLGFVIGPRLNAAGRLDDMSVGIRCLLSDNMEEARELALELNILNYERRAIEDDVRQRAEAALEHIQKDDPELKGICLYHPEWHEGVIGLIASRLKDRFHRPVIIFTDASQEGQIKGSARSIRGFHIRDALDSVAARNPGLLTHFGGHSMAAGMTLPRDNFARFERAFADEVGRQLDDDALNAVVFSDGELSADTLDMGLAWALRHGGPWGQGFPEPLFDGWFNVVCQRVRSGRHLSLVLRWPDQQETVDAIFFNAEETLLNGVPEQVHIVYRVDVNEYQGQRSIQLIIEQMELT